MPLGDGGNRWEGKFADGKPTTGRLTYPNGNVLTVGSGDLKDGSFTGVGVMICANGNIYKGGFLRDQYEGQGRLQLKDGFEKGQFENGRFINGKCKNAWLEGMVRGNLYEGDVGNSKPNGFGTLTHPDKSVYKGFFVDGMRDTTMAGAQDMDIEFAPHQEDLRKKQQEDGDLGEINCPVCFDDFPVRVDEFSSPRISILPCSHAFCTRCIEDWRRRGNSDCPKCRQHFDQDKVVHNVNEHFKMLKTKEWVQDELNANARITNKIIAEVNVATHQEITFAQEEDPGWEAVTPTTEWHKVQKIRVPRWGSKFIIIYII